MGRAGRSKMLPSIVLLKSDVEKSCQNDVGKKWAAHGRGFLGNDPGFPPRKHVVLF